MMSADKMAEWILKSSPEAPPDDWRDSLLNSAQRTWPNALAYAQRELPRHWQPAERATSALELWENVLRSVLRTMSRHRDRQIMDLDAYLVGIFRHRLHRMLIREKRRAQILAFVSPEELVRHENTEMRNSYRSLPDQDLQIREIVACMDSWMKDVWTARMYGYSWSDIGQMMGLTEPQIKMRFRYAISRIRQRLVVRTDRGAAAEDKDKKA